jgi:hypothetical protein
VKRLDGPGVLYESGRGDEYEEKGDQPHDRRDAAKGYMIATRPPAILCQI